MNIKTCSHIFKLVQLNAFLILEVIQGNQEGGGGGGGAVQGFYCFGEN